MFYPFMHANDTNSDVNHQLEKLNDSLYYKDGFAPSARVISTLLRSTVNLNEIQYNNFDQLVGISYYQIILLY